MLLTEYDEVKTMELFREEGYREGFEEGYKEGVQEILDYLVENGCISKEVASKYAKLVLTEFEEKMRIKHRSLFG